ncbi:MAG: hypothetical protein HOE48_09730, partial [Candidatus Latescibacteria bacterium]|nr:hypothetical protein [Candidatus Latescibacterota bacterium]
MPNELTDAEMQSRGILEYGVTTGRQRRKTRTIPWDLLTESVMLNGATQIVRRNSPLKKRFSLLAKTPLTGLKAATLQRVVKQQFKEGTNS